MSLWTFETANNLDSANYRGVSVRSSAALTASYVYTDWSDVRLYEAIDWIIYLTAQGSITRLDVVVQFSLKLTPNETTDWATLQAEDISSTGVATLSDYVLQKTISSVITLGVSSPTRGRFMRIGIKAGVGSVTNSLCAIEAIRRKPKTT